MTWTGQSIDAHLNDLEQKRVVVEKRVEKVEENADIKHPSSNDPNAVKFIVGTDELYISRALE